MSEQKLMALLNEFLDKTEKSRGESPSPQASSWVKRTEKSKIDSIREQRLDLTVSERLNDNAKILLELCEAHRDALAETNDSRKQDGPELKPFQYTLN